jgi:hypothetical protein
MGKLVAEVHRISVDEGESRVEGVKQDALFVSMFVFSLSFV